MIRELIAVGIGGAAGSAARYAISCWMLAGHTLLGFPAGTFAVNAAGSLLIGILLESLSSAAAGWLLVTGFCGGFTTFSTFSADARPPAPRRGLRPRRRIHRPERRGLHCVRRAGHVDRPPVTQLTQKTA